MLRLAKELGHLASSRHRSESAEGTSRRTFRFSGRRVENLRSAPRRGPKIWLRRRGGPEDLPPAPKIGRENAQNRKIFAAPLRGARRREREHRMERVQVVP